MAAGGHDDAAQRRPGADGEQRRQQDERGDRPQPAHLVGADPDGSDRHQHHRHERGDDGDARPARRAATVARRRRRQPLTMTTASRRRRREPAARRRQRRRRRPRRRRAGRRSTTTPVDTIVVLNPGRPHHGGRAMTEADEAGARGRSPMRCAVAAAAAQQAAEVALAEELVEQRLEPGHDGDDERQQRARPSVRPVGVQPRRRRWSWATRRRRGHDARRPDDRRSRTRS